MKMYLAGEWIESGDIVVIGDDGKVMKARPVDSGDSMVRDVGWAAGVPPDGVDRVLIWTGADIQLAERADPNKQTGSWWWTDRDSFHRWKGEYRWRLLPLPPRGSQADPNRRALP